MTYEVGYRRPPASGRFKKGQSGNPRGRPKGSRNFVTLLQDELAQTVVVNENGKKTRVSRLQAMVKRIVAGALQGDQRALLTMVEILKRTGQLDAHDEHALLPDDYQTILSDYVASQQASPPRTVRTKQEKKA